ncbi:hypothetical protein PENSPDRAFT_750776 [Peniophora sp. CONT]|nr:hypothetical protein PENSPDRAFT_750776 [Peniophora sp. CONT]
MPASWKAQQRPASVYGTGTLAIGLRIVYAGKKAQRFPRATIQPCLLDQSQRGILLEDLAHLSRKIGGANPRKDDTQISGVLDGCIEVVWPELRKRTARYEHILSEMSQLNTLSGDYLAERSISCLIVYSLPPTTTTLLRYQPWDKPCIFVVDPGTVDKCLNSKCRATLISEPRLDQALARMRSYNEDARHSAGESEPFMRAGNRRYTPPSPEHSRYKRSTERAPSLPPTPARSPSPSTRPRMHSRSPSRSPPRKRLKPNPDHNERSMLLETVRKLEDERDAAFEREDALRRKLELVADETKSFTILEQQVHAWTSKAKRVESRVRDQEQRLHSVVDAHIGGTHSLDAPASASDATTVSMLESMMQDYREREERALKGATEARACYTRRMSVGPVNDTSAFSKGKGLSDALAVVAQLAMTMGL